MKAIDRQRRSWSDVWWVYGRSGERFSSGESRFFRSCGQRTSGFLFGSSLDSPCGNVVQPDHERSGLSQGLRAALVTACYQQSDAKCPRVRHCRRWRASRRTAQPDAPAGHSPSHVSHRKGRAARTGEAGGGLGAQGHIVRGPRDRGCREAQRLQQHAPASAHGLGQGLRGSGATCICVGFRLGCCGLACPALFISRCFEKPWRTNWARLARPG